MNENVRPKSNGVVRNGQQNGGESKPVKTSSAPWKSSYSNDKKPAHVKTEYKEKAVSPQSVTVSYSNSKDNGIEKAYQDVQNTASSQFSQSSSQSNMEPKKVSQASFTLSSSVKSTTPAVSSQNEEEPENELPKSGSLLGLRSMFESQKAESKTSLPRSPSYSRDSKSNGSAASSTANIPKSKSDNFNATNGQQQQQQQQVKTSATFHVSTENTDVRPVSRQFSQDKGGMRKGGKVPWYQQVTQMAYDGPSTISAVQNVRRSSASGSGSSWQQNQPSKAAVAVSNNNNSSQPKQQIGTTNGGSWRQGMGNTTVKAESATTSKSQQQPSSQNAPVQQAPAPQSFAAAPAPSSGSDANSTKVSKITTTITPATENATKKQQYEKNPQQQQKQQQTAKLSLVPSPTPSSSSPVPSVSLNTAAPAPGLLQRSTSTALLSTEATVQPMTKDSQGFTTEDSIEERVTLKHWDPTPLLEDLYTVRLQPEASDAPNPYINMEGYMEKLPMNKKKATLLKTWKRRYFKATDGALYYYENSMDEEDVLPAVNVDAQMTEKASGVLPLSGGHIEELDNNMIGIDDGRGRYLLVRCPNDADYQKWMTALTSQTKMAPKSAHVKPVLQSLPSIEKKVIVIDLGSANCRAGILGNQPSLPQVFFPTIVAVNKTTGEQTFGIKALSSSVRADSKISFPIRPSTKVDKFSIDMDMMPGLFSTMFSQLQVNPKEYWVLISAPGNLSDKYKTELMNLLVARMGCQGANIMSQTMLALYAYSARSGIVVDIGERSEILPVTDGYIVEGGVTRQAHGGNKVAEILNTTLTERKYRFFTDVESFIVRLTMERLTFVSMDYDDDLKRCQEEPEDYRESVSLEEYGLPQGSWTHVSNDLGRFKAPEGLFQQEVWEMDNPPLPKLIQTAIQACPMDARREMWRSVYLSGGVTMIPGFMERLQQDLEKIAPTSIKVEVHGSPQRYHAAYVGACALAGMPVFLQSCISAAEWKQHGAQALRKWHMY